MNIRLLGIQKHCEISLSVNVFLNKSYLTERDALKDAFLWSNRYSFIWYLRNSGSLLQTGGSWKENKTLQEIKMQDKILRYSCWVLPTPVGFPFHLQNEYPSFLNLLNNSFSYNFIFWSKLYTPSTLNIQMKLILLWVWAELKLP